MLCISIPCVLIFLSFYVVFTDFPHSLHVSFFRRSRRDEALKAAEAALRTEGERMQELLQDVSGLKQNIRAEQELNEKQTSITQRLAAELVFIEQQQKEIDHRSKKLSTEAVCRVIPCSVDLLFGVSGFGEC